MRSVVDGVILALTYGATVHIRETHFYFHSSNIGLEKLNRRYFLLVFSTIHSNDIGENLMTISEHVSHDETGGLTE